MAGGANPASTVTPTMPAQMAQPTQPNVFGQAAGALTSGINAANAAASFGAGKVGTSFGYSPQNVTAQQAFTGMENYQNPFTQQVIDASMADLERQRQMQMNQIGASAAAARAFGGSRHGVAESLTNEGFAQQGGQLASNLRMQGFNTALGASQQDIANQMQANLANQAARARAAEFGQSSRLQAQMANQQAGLQGAQLGLSAAGQLGNLANLGFGFGTQLNQQQMQQGAMQQGLMQALIDAAKGQYAGFTGAPQQALTLPLAALGASNMGQQTTTQSQKPGLFNYLALGLGSL